MTTTAAAPAPAFIVQDIFPTNQIHLIFGPQARDKTILLLQIMRDWTAGLQVFSHDSYPARYCWVSCERNTDSLRAHMTRLGIDPPSTYHFSLVDSERRENQTLEAALSIARQRVNCSVLFIDGLHALCPGKIIDSRDVTNFLVQAQQLMRSNRLTIIATAASPKYRPEDSTTPPGERFLGSGSWASMTDTKILVEPYDPMNLKDPARRVTLMPTHDEAVVGKYEHRPEGLIWIGNDDTGAPGLDSWLECLPPGEIVTTSSIKNLAQEMHISRSTVTRWIKSKVEAGVLIPDEYSRGLYSVADPATTSVQ
jgi:AAA domain